MIVDDNSHVLAKHYELLPSGRRFRVPKSNPVSFVLQSIASLNRCICSEMLLTAEFDLDTRNHLPEGRRS